MFATPICRLLIVCLLLPGAWTIAHAAPVKCTKEHQDAADSARATAQEALRIAIDKLSRTTADAKVALTTWFGNSNDATRTHVIGKLTSARQWLPSVDFLCLYSNEGEWRIEFEGQLYDAAGGGFAYVSDDDPDTIFLSLKFYDAPSTGENSRYGTVIHEVTHFPSGGGISDEDEHYGRSPSKQLARTSTARALNHADAYQFLTEDLSGL